MPVEIFLIFPFLIMVMGLIFLTQSPTIIKLDKGRNRCIKETKFIWQKKYKCKILCKLSEIEYATIISGELRIFSRLCLKLKSGKNITILSKLKERRGFSLAFYDEAEKINNFLNNNDRQCTIEYSFFNEGSAYVVLALGTIFFISVFLYYVKTHPY